MRPWNESVPALRKTLRQHFPNAGQERIHHFADEIHSGAGAAASLQWIERNDRHPKDDLKDLENAAGYLIRAANKIREVGWHGGIATQEFAQKVHQMQFRYDGRAVMGVQDSIEKIALFFEGLGEEIRHCADDINPNAETVMSAFGDERPSGRSRGRPKGTAAYFVARDCYTAFRELSGKEPSVITNPYKDGNPAGGLFFDFLKDVFLDLGIRESEEVWARVVCKEKNP